MPPAGQIRPLVLVVEDDPEMREVYRFVLSGNGFRVIAVQDGLAALRILEQELPALIVLDLELPFVSGQDVARELRSHATTCLIPVVVVTGFDGSDIESDVTCLLRKPIEPDQLVKVVRDCLRAHVEPAVPT